MCGDPIFMRSEGAGSASYEDCSDECNDKKLIVNRISRGEVRASDRREHRKKS